MKKVCLVLIGMIAAANAIAQDNIRFEPTQFFGKFATPRYSNCTIELSGKTVCKDTTSPVEPRWFNRFVKEACKHGVKIAFDHKPEKDSRSFLVLQKGRNAIAIFNARDTTFIITMHSAIKRIQTDYSQTHYSSRYDRFLYGDNKQEGLSTAVLKEKVTAELGAKLALLTEENLRKAMSELMQDHNAETLTSR